MFPKRLLFYWGPKDHVNLRILQAMVSGIHFVLGLRTRKCRSLVFVWSLKRLSETEDPQV